MKLVALLCGLLVSAPLCAFEIKERTIVLTDEEVEICTDNGGCALITHDMLVKMLQRAHDVGLHECRNAL